jgi:Fic family protein
VLAVSATRRYIREGAPLGTRYFEAYRPDYEVLFPELREGGGGAGVNELVSWTANRAREDNRTTVLLDDEQSSDEHATPDDERGRRAAVVYEQLDPFEPYTADELGSVPGLDREQVETALRKLVREHRAQERSHAEGPTSWVSEPPTRSCPGCNREFEAEFHRPVLSTVQFCSRYGTQL